MLLGKETLRMPMHFVVFTCPENKPQTPMTKRTLSTADPKIVPVPMSPSVMKTPSRQEGGKREQNPILSQYVKLITNFLYIAVILIKHKRL